MTTEIEQYLNGRGVESLCHFTRVDNLPSILANGLLTKEARAVAGIEAVINDPYRYDGTGAVSATISYPNYKMFYRLRCDHPKTEWVVLKLTYSLLWRTRCAFSSTNAGDGSVFNIPIAERQGLPALHSMFSDYENIKRATLGIPDHYTTNPQAEVLLLDGASVGDITGVYFEQAATFKQYKPLLLNLPCYCNGTLFGGRRDSAHWKKIWQ